jgi:altronate dehydratase
MVGAALLLEHGCERTHNDLMRHALKQYGVDPQRFGYASIQLDGGIEAVMAKVIEWFASRPEPEETGGAAASALAAAPAFSLGLAAAGPVPETTAHALAELTAGIIASGGSVILPHSASLTGNPAFLESLGLEAPLADTLAYGQVGRHPGLHLMATPTAPLIEALTGLGGTGVHSILVHVADAPVQGHPLIPTLQVATAGSRAAAFAGDLDFVIDSGTADTGHIRDELLGRIRDTLAQDYAPRAWSRGHTGFQLTRGLLGVSL